MSNNPLKRPNCAKFVIRPASPTVKVTVKPLASLGRAYELANAVLQASSTMVNCFSRSVSGRISSV